MGVGGPFLAATLSGTIGFGGGRKTEEGEPEKQRDDLSVWSFGMGFFSEIVFTTLR